MTLEKLIKRLFNKVETSKSQISTLDEQVQQIEARERVHGMDIYAQDTEPDLETDYIWINTNVDQFEQ